MPEKKNYCTYLKKLIDQGLCYDMQMISESKSERRRTKKKKSRPK